MPDVIMSQFEMGYDIPRTRDRRRTYIQAAVVCFAVILTAALYCYFTKHVEETYKKVDYVLTQYLNVNNSVESKSFDEYDYIDDNFLY